MRRIAIVIVGLILSVFLAIIGAFSQKAIGVSKIQILGGHTASGGQATSDGQAVNEEEKADQLNNNETVNNEAVQEGNAANLSEENSPEEEAPEEIDMNSKYLLLVNKENRLSEDYVPENLVLPNIAFIDYADPIVRVVEQKTAEALEEMFRAAEQEGIILLGKSGYRSYNIQADLYAKNVKRKGEAHASKYSAQAGASEHQSALAMDIVSSDYQNLSTGFENTEAFKWLQENCYKYGFILRYPEGKEEITGYAYEPWHYRYVGLPHSQIITESNLTLEEYIQANMLKDF